jgi:hypothetical protein
MEVVHRLAAAHPQALLPCPTCAAAVKGRNLPDHLGKQHPGASLPGPVLRGRRWGLPRSVVLGSSEIRCGRRAVTLPAPLLGGRFEKTATHGNIDQGTQWTEITREGAYLQVGPLVITCRKVPGVAKLWAGVGQGRTRRRSHVRLAVPEFMALVYALAERGDLIPRSTFA